MGLTREAAVTGMRVLVLAALICGLLVAQAAAASAHTRTQETTNVESVVTFDPGLEGVTWTVHTGGLLVEVEHRGDALLIIEGYEGEPYLRIGPDGVERNRNSPATYLERERFGRVAMPPNADAEAAPDWHHVDDVARHVWHDHRTHWMSPDPPAFVTAGTLDRGFMTLDLTGHLGRADERQGPFHEWSIPLTYDGTATALEGRLAWRDAPPVWPWLLLGGALVVPGLLGLRRGGRAGPARTAAVVVGAVAAVNAVHLVDDLIAWPSHPLDDLFGLLHTGLFLTLGLAGALWAWRIEAGRLLALGIAGAAVLYHQGLVHAPLLLASGFPTVWPDALIRLTVGLAFAQAVVVATVLVVVARRPPGDPEPAQPSSTTSTVASMPASR